MPNNDYNYSTLVHEEVWGQAAGSENQHRSVAGDGFN